MPTSTCIIIQPIRPKRKELKSKMTYSRARSCSTASEPRQSKEELWEGALERPVGDGAVVQMIGLESKKHIVYARVVRNDDGNNSLSSPQVTVMSAIQTMVDEGM